MRKISKKFEGKQYEINKDVLPEQTTLEVGLETTDTKVDDKQSFESYKEVYKDAITEKCLSLYGTTDDKSLWEDTAKEMYLASENYIPTEGIKVEGELDTKSEEAKQPQKAEFVLSTANKSMIEKLEKGSAFTWENMNTDYNNLTKIVEFFKENTPNIILPVNFYTWTGKEFNEIYGLTGSNAYPDDITFLSIPLDNWDGLGTLPIVKMQVGTRWLDDIVDNNAIRQGTITENKTFDDKVKAIKANLKKNDKRLSDETAENSAKRIAGSMIKNESKSANYNETLEQLNTILDYLDPNNAMYLDYNNIVGEFLDELYNYAENKVDEILDRNFPNLENGDLKIESKLDYAFEVYIDGLQPIMYTNDWSVNDAKKEYIDNEGRGHDISEVKVRYFEESQEVIIESKLSESQVSDYTIEELQNVLNDEGNDYKLQVTGSNSKTKWLNIDKEDLKLIGSTLKSQLTKKTEVKQKTVGDDIKVYDWDDSDIEFIKSLVGDTVTVRIEDEGRTFGNIIDLRLASTDYIDSGIVNFTRKFYEEIEQHIKSKYPEAELALNNIGSIIYVRQKTDKGSDKVTTKIENRKLQEDNYDSGIFKEIENAFEEAGLNPRRFIDEGVLTKNIGWTLYSDRYGSQQISCDGSWYDEDEEEDDDFYKDDEVELHYVDESKNSSRPDDVKERLRQARQWKKDVRNAVEADELEDIANEILEATEDIKDINYAGEDIYNGFYDVMDNADAYDRGPVTYVRSVKLNMQNILDDFIDNYPDAYAEEDLEESKKIKKEDHQLYYDDIQNMSTKERHELWMTEHDEDFKDDESGDNMFWDWVEEEFPVKELNENKKLQEHTESWLTETDPQNHRVKPFVDLFKKEYPDYKIDKLYLETVEGGWEPCVAYIESDGTTYRVFVGSLNDGMYMSNKDSVKIANNNYKSEYDYVD